MVMVLHACAAFNNRSMIQWIYNRHDTMKITIVTHASIHRGWLNMVTLIYNSMIVPTQQKHTAKATIPLHISIEYLRFHFIVVKIIPLLERFMEIIFFPEKFCKLNLVHLEYNFTMLCLQIFSKYLQ